MCEPSLHTYLFPTRPLLHLTYSSAPPPTAAGGVPLSIVRVQHDDAGRKRTRREGPSPTRERLRPFPSKKEERWVACGPSSYLSFGLPGAKQ